MEKIVAIEDMISVWMCFVIVNIGLFTAENQLTPEPFWKEVNWFC